MPANIVAPPFSFQGLVIERAITHRIYTKDTEKQKVRPKFSEKILKLDQDSIDTIQVRITKSLGSKSHGIEVSIENIDAGGFFQIASSMLHCEEDMFIEHSKTIANKLNDALFQTNAPGGILAIISGRVGDNAKPFIAVIKTDPQDGFKTKDEDDVIGIEYIAELLLTEGQKFYKIGFLVENISKPPVDNMYSASNYRIFLYDHLVTSTETRLAAAYFYSQFLGTTIMHSSKKLTQNFYEYTVKFTNTSNISDDDKSDILEALRTELRSQKATINAASFAAENMNEDIRAKYCSFLAQNNFPNNSISKDNEYIKSKLRRKRKYAFSNNVLILTPPEKMSDFLTIENTEEENVTIVKIKGILERQE